MAAIAYTTIESTVKTIVSDALGSGYTVTAEVEQPMDTRPWVAIHLDRRDAPAEQPIAAGTRQRYQLVFSIWCWCWSLDTPAHAAAARDTLVGKVENIILQNRTMSGQVLSSQMFGGAFETAKYEGENVTGQAFISGGEIIYKADVMATT